MADTNNWLKFLFICCNYEIKLNHTSSNKMLHLNVSNLLSYDETTEAPVSENICQYFRIAKARFTSTTGKLIQKLGYCKNLQELDYHIQNRPSAEFEQVYFLSKLQKLQILKLCFYYSPHSDLEENDLNDFIAFPNQMFGNVGFHLLTELEISSFVIGFTENQ